jgi:hypothetical protein
MAQFHQDSGLEAVRDLPSRASSFATVRRFERVVVVPFTELLLSADREHKGGPIWPDWPEDDHIGYWHSSTYARADTPPDVPESYAEVAGGHFFWVGALYNHFGHQIRDFSSRIIGSLRADPDAVLVYATAQGRPGVPGWFWGIQDWFGVPRNRVCVITEPTRFSSLSVVPQPEWAGTNARNVKPDPDYLEALTQHAERAIGRIRRSGTVYVSRSAMTPGHNVLGEREIDHWFERNGHLVVHPQRLPLKEQLTNYVSATHLIFSGGSALHGLQLLGRNVSDVTVIRRSPDAPDYQALLASRCLSNREVDAVRATTTIGGRVPGAGAKVLLDSRRLVRDLAIDSADGRSRVPFRHHRFMVRAIFDLSWFTLMSLIQKGLRGIRRRS